MTLRMRSIYWCYMENNEQQTLNDILETVTFLKDHAMTKEEGVTKKELLGLEQRIGGKFSYLEDKMATTVALTEAKSEVITHVDDFITLHKKLEVKLIALQSKYARLEGQLHFLAKHLNVALPEFSE